MTELAYVNGHFCPIADATVSIEDRGFQFGDAVYEVIAAHFGRPFLLDQHLQRLRRSADAIHLDYDVARIEPIVAEGLRRSGLDHTQIYIQLTRGIAPRAHGIPDHAVPTLVITFRPLVPVPDHLRRQGVSVITVPDIRWRRCYVKAVTLLPNVLARHDAVQRGYFDAIFVTEAGEVRESTSANVFIVHDGRIRIPPRDNTILHGITQACIMQCAADVGLAVQETSCDVASLRAADEVFLSSTAVDVLPVTAVDGRPIRTGHVGPITRRLDQAFRDRVSAA
ncbi:MAG: aminotransferase class IV [Phycisphaerae bacterium]